MKPAIAALHAGQRLGRYLLVAPLGTGGQGVVWEAVLSGPAGFRRTVALKLLRPGLSTPSHGLLIREARVGALVHHPHVVVTHDLGLVDGHWFVAMELVRGPSLAELSRRTRLRGRALLEVGLHAVAGLAEIHALTHDDASGEEAAPQRVTHAESPAFDDRRTLALNSVPPLSTPRRVGSRGVVHRDVKPSNLLLDRSGLLKLSDLGLAGLSGSGRRGGTPGGSVVRRHG